MVQLRLQAEIFHNFLVISDFFINNVIKFNNNLINFHRLGERGKGWGGGGGGGGGCFRSFFFKLSN